MFRSLIHLGFTLGFKEEVSDLVLALKYNEATSLLVQWLRLSASNLGAQVPSLVGELDPTCHN